MLHRLRHPPSLGCHPQSHQRYFLEFTFIFVYFPRQAETGGCKEKTRRAGLLQESTGHKTAARPSPAAEA